MQSLSILFQISLLWISLLFLGHLPNREENENYQYAAAGKTDYHYCKILICSLPHVSRLRIFSKLTACILVLPIKLILSVHVCVQFLNVTGIAIGHGIATASDTLSSQVIELFIFNQDCHNLTSCSSGAIYSVYICLYFLYIGIRI